MARFTQASTVRAALAAAAVALFASHTAFASQPKEISYWADAQTASRAGNNDIGAKGDFASLTTDNNDLAAHALLIARGGHNDIGAKGDFVS